MPVRVLVVDDSSFFRKQISKILSEDPGIVVIDTAEDGKEAVEKVLKLKPDVVTMDVEMPVMDGITATREIMQKSPTAILMFSSLTMDGARATIGALEAGAVDFLPKRFEDITSNKEEAKQMLCARVLAVSKQRGSMAFKSSPAPSARPSVPPQGRPAPAVAPSAKPAASTPAPMSRPVRAKSGKHYSLVAIGTSTGGPVALQAVLTKLPKSFPLPIVLIQHMPGTFTPAFAQRLNELCAIEVKEAQDLDVLKPGVAYLAPGGKQMNICKRGGQPTLLISEPEIGQTYKPSVDITFASAAEAFPGSVLALVLTGMGADGREGARKLKAGGATIWSQDEASCVVYGMPAAIAEAGLADKVLALNDIGESIANEV